MKEGSGVPSAFSWYGPMASRARSYTALLMLAAEFKVEEYSELNRYRPRTISLPHTSVLHGTSKEVGFPKTLFERFPRGDHPKPLDYQVLKQIIGFKNELMLISHTIDNPNCEVIQLRARSSQLHNVFNTPDDYYWHTVPFRSVRPGVGRVTGWPKFGRRPPRGWTGDMPGFRPKQRFGHLC